MNQNNAALFVDVNNLYFTVGKKAPGKKVDYKKYLEWAKTHANVSRAFAYVFQAEREAIHFITCLRKLGYETRCKAPRTVGEKFKKMDYNVSICMDVVRMIPKVDAILLGTSDPEIVPLIQWVKDQGVQTIILSSLIPQEIKEVSDKYFEIPDEVVTDKKEEEESA